MKESRQKLILALSIVAAGLLFCYCTVTYRHAAATLTQDALYKILPVGDPSHSYRHGSDIQPMPLDTSSNFMHLAHGNQVERIATKFFHGAQHLDVLELDSDVLRQHGGEIREEANKPGGEIFPHLYGMLTIPARAVKKIYALEEQGNGLWLVKNKDN